MDRCDNEEALGAYFIFAAKPVRRRPPERQRHIKGRVCNSPNPNLSCPRVFLPSPITHDLQLVDPFLSAFISIRSNAHSPPKPVPALFLRRVLHPVPRIRHPFSPPNLHRRSDLFDSLIFNAADGSLGDSRSASARTIKTFLFQVRGLVLEVPAYLCSSPFVSVFSSTLFAPATSSRSGVAQAGDKPTEMVEP